MNSLLKIDSSLDHLSNELLYEVESLCDVDYLKDSSLVFIKEIKYLKRFCGNISTCQNLTVIISVKVSNQLDLKLKKVLEKFKCSLFLSPNIEHTMCLFSKYFYDKQFFEINNYVDGRQLGTTVIHPTSLISQHVFIGEHVEIGKNVKIHSGARIYPKVSIGDNCEIFSNVVIYSNCKLSTNVRVHANTTIGSDGFGYNFIKNKHQKIWHLGGVEIDNDVEIGSNTCIDSGTFSPTIIGEGTKMDNFVQIAHNCRIGKHVILCGHVGISGSCHVGDYSIFAGMSGLSHGVTIGKECVVAAQAVVSSNWPDKVKLGGNPARPFGEWLKSKVKLKKLLEKTDAIK